METKTGKVKWFNNQKGYGFIIPDDGGKELFVHFKDVIGDRSLNDDHVVEFEIIEGKKGLQAANVRIVGVQREKESVQREA